MTVPAITVALDDKRRHVSLWWQKLQHAVGGVPLLLAGLRRLQTPGSGGDLLAIAEIVVAAVLLVLLARDIRTEVVTSRRAAASEPRAHAAVHGGPDPFDIVAGALLIIESILSVHPGGKPFYARPLFTTGVATILIGVLHGRIARISWKRREIRLDASGVHARLSRFRRFTVAWTDVRDIRVTATSITIDTTTGVRTIPLGRYRNADDVRSAFEHWGAMRALPHAT